MKSTSQRKTTYSPVRRHLSNTYFGRQRATLEDYPVSMIQDGYIDDDEFDNNQQTNIKQRQYRATNEQQLRDIGTSSSEEERGIQSRGVGGGNRSGNNNDEDEDTDGNNLEEVYLCNCCGVTKELDPAMKHMPTFRVLFFLFNFFVFAFSLADLGMGLWFRIDPKVYEIHKYIETQNFTIAGWILLFGGFTGCLIALLGFIAAARQKVGLLIFYLVFVITLTVCFIGTIVLLTVYGLGTQLELFLTKEIYEQIRRRTMNTELDLFMNTDAAQFLDFVQVKMRCCGASDFRDYQKLGMVIPTTCYTIAGNYVNAPGCGRAIRELFDIRAGLAVGFATGSVIAQILTIILSSLMICAIYNWRANPRPVSPREATSFATSTLSRRSRSSSPVATTLQPQAQHSAYSYRPPSRNLSSIAV